MRSTVGEAFGFDDVFSDPMINKRDSKMRYRADVLLLNIRSDKKNRTFGIKEFGNE